MDGGMGITLGRHFLCRGKPEAMDRFSLSFPVTLEICFRVIQSIGSWRFRPSDWGEFGVVFHFLANPFEVFGVVGFKEKFTAGNKSLVQ